ncbi:MAG: hypothetical protein HY066_03875 [Betaproteobacteria bacterium]|nr:hypothetical protein [Betaproteobacteria bacterium]
MQVRKILGGVVIDQGKHCIAKLENGKYAVGEFGPGQNVLPEAQFGTLNAAYDHWLQLALMFRTSSRSTVSADQPGSGSIGMRATG